MTIVVVALGKIGLPLAVQFARKGHPVVGLDIHPRVVSAVNSGREPFPGEQGLGAAMSEVVRQGWLRATTDYRDAIPDAETVVVVVPLVVNESTGAPDFASLDRATRSIAASLRPGTLVSYETTVPVGTSRLRFAPMLEAGSGLREGTDFHVVFSPERVFTGRVFADLRRYPKLIGALGDIGALKAKLFYESVLDFDDRPDLSRPNGVWNLGSAEAAEMAKLVETTYRDVNIGLANQFALFAEKNGLDVYQVIEACNSQPFSQVHRPGIAVGGHCIPVYPRLYLSNDPEASIVVAAREANVAMPGAVVQRLSDLLGGLEDLRVAVLGASYRGGVKETAFSGVFRTVAELAERRARVAVHDPLYSDYELRELGFVPYRLGDPVDAAVVQADHTQYASLSERDLPGARAIADGRAVLRRENFDRCRILRIGVGA